MTLTYYLYNNIPGTHPSWTVAMLATGRRDADNAMKAHWHGGKFVGVVDSGKVKADCGDLSAAASQELAERNRREMEEYKRAQEKQQGPLYDIIK